MEKTRHSAVSVYTFDSKNPHLYRLSQISLYPSDLWHLVQSLAQRLLVLLLVSTVSGTVSLSSLSASANAGKDEAFETLELRDFGEVTFSGLFGHVEVSGTTLDRIQLSLEGSSQKPKVPRLLDLSLIDFSPLNRKDAPRIRLRVPFNLSARFHQNGGSFKLIGLKSRSLDFNLRDTQFEISEADSKTLKLKLESSKGILRHTSAVYGIHAVHSTLRLEEVNFKLGSVLEADVSSIYGFRLLGERTYLRLNKSQFISVFQSGTWEKYIRESRLEFEMIYGATSLFSYDSEVKFKFPLFSMSEDAYWRLENSRVSLSLPKGFRMPLVKRVFIRGKTQGLSGGSGHWFSDLLLKFTNFFAPSKSTWIYTSFDSNLNEDYFTTK